MIVKQKIYQTKLSVPLNIKAAGVYLITYLVNFRKIKNSKRKGIVIKSKN